MMWAGWGIHWLWMVGFWLVVIGLVVWAVGRLAPTSSARGPGGARAVLDERYARGELDGDEYRRLRRELER